MKTTLYNLKGETVGEIDLSDKIFARPWNPDLVHQVLLAMRANRHYPWAHTKTRGEVRGGGRKPWRQKHTGRARHGSIRSPIWRGGGVAHGPRNERSYAQKINKKMVHAALLSVLSKKLTDQEVRVVDSLAIGSPKTKALCIALKSFIPRNGILNALLVPRISEAAMIARAARNIPHVAALNPQLLNVEALLQHKNVVFDKEAVAAIK